MENALKPKRMWVGGPLRRFSGGSVPGARMPLATGGYGGAYICDKCQKPVDGVYEASEGWICGGCKRNAPKESEAELIAEAA